MSIRDCLILLDQAAVADLLQLSEHTLRTWRGMGKGPAFRKLGGRVIYEKADVELWVAQQPKHNAPAEVPDFQHMDRINAFRTP